VKVAIIIARGGSKRIPRKNIKTFAGRPIILYPIWAALKAPIFDEVFVSTDDHEIANIEMGAGAMVPFMRPASLADDHATTLQVMGHAVRYLLQHGAPLEAACCIYPCTPFVEPSDFQPAFEAMMTKAAAYAFPVIPAQPGVEPVLQMDENDFIRNAQSDSNGRQWNDPGQWYWGTVVAWQQQLHIFAGRAIGIPTDRNRAIDINTQEDWNLAEAFYAKWESPP